MLPTLTALQAMLLLLPGFIVQELSLALVPAKEKSHIVVWLFNALVRSVLVLGAGVLVSWGGLWLWLTELPSQDAGQVSWGYPLLVLCVSIGMGLAESALRNWGVLYRICRQIRVSDRTGKVDVWSDIMSAESVGWVRIEAEDSRVIEGWIELYSENGQDMELFLRDVKIFLPGGEQPMEADGLLLTPKFPCKTVEFHGLSTEGQSEREGTSDG